MCWLRGFAGEPVADAFVIRRVLEGGISTDSVAFAVVSCQYGALLGVPGTCGAVRGGSSFGTLLGPEATGTLFSAQCVGERGPVASGVPAPAGDHCLRAGLSGLVRGHGLSGGDGVVV